ncbi:type II toxin-antitoxin system VapC family toxin [Roseofilum sp. BLCC_M91]|uniref:Ribonuclease VapC n=1 Tax=Roseofilum halophilum BLCC-M91 TaxID=3022259 RepID=A0ABT7BGV7_9CYAN|nr:type II toxin-antitoxin system VapC family toxin [Roseofilum halophilum BLCC-M91]
MGYLLDTNIITALVKRNSRVVTRLQYIEGQGAEIYLSAVSYYEVKRGLLYINATRQLANLEIWCARIPLLYLDNLNIFQKAVEIHANLRRKGEPMEDADILIAATAIAHNLILVSHDSDMRRVEDVKLEDWL